MSSRVRGKEDARARAAEMRAKQAREAQRRRVLLATGAIAVVIVIVVGLVLVKVIGKDDDDDGSRVAEVGHFRAARGRAHGRHDGPGLASATRSVPPVSRRCRRGIDAPALTENGKPKVLYIGAEYCPFCAAAALADGRRPVAVRRPGPASRAQQSAAEDVFPEHPDAVLPRGQVHQRLSDVRRLRDRDQQAGRRSVHPARHAAGADQKIFDTYNKPPYIDSAGGIPFANIGGKYVTSGASFSPELLEGKSRAEIAAALSDPSSDIAKAVVGNANVLTAAICEATGNKPAVCTSAGVQAGAAALAKGQK